MSKFLTDIEIAREASKKNIAEIASDRLNLNPDELIPFGYDKAKIPFSLISNLEKESDGILILVTAMTPTTAGEGKTTTSV